MGQSFKDLLVWQPAVQLTIDIYKLTGTFPDSERFGLTNQLRGASVSIASNIAEGYGRATSGEYVQFLGHARGPASEVETQLVIARALGFGVEQRMDTAEKLCSEVGRMLRGMMRSLNTKSPSLVPSPQSLSKESVAH